MNMDLPIVCSLSRAELQERKATILASMRDALIDRTAITGGYRYQFAKHSIGFHDVTRIAELERQCCRFLSFDVGQSESKVWLDVTGQPEALAVIQDLFG